MRVLFIILLTSVFLVPTYVEGRAGSGNTYSTSEQPPSDIVQPSGTEPPAMKKDDEPLNHDPEAPIRPLTPEQEREHKAAVDRDTREWYRKNVRVSSTDYVENRWLGVVLVAFLLICGTSTTGFMVFVADREGTSFLKDRFVPVVGINVPVWAIVWAINRSFLLPSWPLIAAATLTTGILIHDGLATSRSVPSVNSGRSSPVEKPQAEKAP